MDTASAPDAASSQVMSSLAGNLFGNGASDTSQAATPHEVAAAHLDGQTQSPAHETADPATLPDPNQQTPGPADGQIAIPKHRFDEVNQSRREWADYARQLEARVAQMDGYVRAMAEQRAASNAPPPQQVAPEEPPLPDLINDPQGYALAIEERAQRRASQQVAEAKRMAIQTAWANDDMRAEQRFGRETVDTAKEWVRQNGLADHLSRRADPYTAAVDLYRTAQLRAAIPNADLNQFRVQVLRDALSNPEFVKQIAPVLLRHRPGVQPPPAVLPPPLSGQPRNNAVASGTMFSSGREAAAAMFARRAAPPQR